MNFGHFRFVWWTKTTSKIKNRQKTNTTPTKWKTASNWRKNKTDSSVERIDQKKKITIRKTSKLKRSLKKHTENMNRITEYRQKSVCTWTAFVINFLLIINLSQNVFGKFLSPLFFYSFILFWSEFIASKRFDLFVVFHSKTHIEWEWENEKRRQNDKRPAFCCIHLFAQVLFHNRAGLLKIEDRFSPRKWPIHQKSLSNWLCISKPNISNKQCQP